MRVGIVGAGIAGLSCAEGLVQRGHEVVLFDKGRGPGGRMSTRRIPTPQGVAHFDHGAQYFTARDERFASQVRTWIADGVAAPWPAAGSDAHVGVPAMNSPVRRLAEHHLVHWSARVTGVERRGDCWRLVVGDDVHDVDFLVIAIPAEQAAALLADAAPDLASRAAAAISEPCWTALAAFAGPIASEHDCWSGEAALAWAARNNAKPGRTGPESWVLQATPKWSRRHIDDGPDEVAVELTAALAAEVGAELPDSIATAAHLWRFARCAWPARGDESAIVDRDRRLGLCGDWLIGPRVESAWLSGALLALEIG